MSKESAQLWIPSPKREKNK